MFHEDGEEPIEAMCLDGPFVGTRIEFGEYELKKMILPVLWLQRPEIMVTVTYRRFLAKEGNKKYYFAMLDCGQPMPPDGVIKAMMTAIQTLADRSAPEKRVDDA